MTLFTSSTWSAGDTAHESIEILGFILIAICVLGRTWSTHYIGGKKKTELVDVGPYSMCRNPLYVFTLIGAAGMGFTTGAATYGIVFGLVCFVIFDQVIRREETFLADAFGAPFQRYLATVPRWMPRLSLWADVDEIVVRPKLILITFRDACLLLLAFPYFEGIEYLQGAGILPVLAQLP